MAISLTDVSIDVANGVWNPAGSYIITGTGFGTKASGLSISNNFELETVGAVVTSPGGLNVSNKTGTSIVNSGSHSGNNCISQDYSLEGFPKIYHSLSGLQTRFYMSCWVKWSGTVTGATVWKFGRVGANTTYSGNPKAGETYTSTDQNTPASFGGEIVSSSGIVGYGANATLAPSASAIYTADAWHFYELEFYTGTVDGNDSYFVVRVDGINAVVWSGIEFLTTALSDLPDWILTPINGLDGAPPITMLLDDLYIDESRARVVMTDNATYASSTKWAVQPILTYSDTEITVTKSRQVFSIGESAFLHLFDDTGVLVSEGNAVTVEAD